MTGDTGTPTPDPDRVPPSRSRWAHGTLAAVLGLRGVIGHLILPLLLTVKGLPFLALVLVKPGEPTALIAGTQVRDGHVPLILTIAALATGAVAGDLLGWLTGRLWGATALARLSRHGGHRGSRVVGRAQRLLRERGTLAVFAARPTVLSHGVMPALAGAASMPLRRFVPASLAGAVTWAAFWVAGGAGLGAAWSRLAPTSRVILVATIVGVAALYGGARLVRRSRRRPLLRRDIEIRPDLVEVQA